jgi:nicotinamidase-related amidase
MPAKTVSFLDDKEWPASCFAVDLAIQRETSALCTIDMQNYCVDPEGDLAHGLRLHDPKLFEAFSGRVGEAISRTSDLLEAFRNQGRRVVFTRHGSLTHDGGDLVERRRRREQIALDASGEQSGHLPLAGSRGHQIVAALTPRPGELVLDKNTSSAFNSTAIDLFLRNMGVTTLILAGLVSDQCVLMTALDAADRGFHCILAADASTTIDPGSHEAALLMFGRVWGYVMQTEEIVAWLSGARTTTTSATP